MRHPHAWLVVVGVAWGWAGWAFAANPPTTPEGGALPANEVKILFNNWNKDAVTEKARESPTFALDETTVITYVSTYHWNRGKGTDKPGTISLKHSDGAVYGPWEASGGPGQVGNPNALWEVAPCAPLKPGVYTVIDSDPDTWSNNGRSNGVGFAEVRGVARQGDPLLTDAQRLARSYARLSWACNGLGKSDEALKLADKAIELDKQCATGWANKGRALAGKGKSPDAIAALMNALHLGGADPETWTALGQVLFKLGNFKDCVLCCDTALAMNPRDTVAKQCRTDAAKKLVK